MERSPVPYIVLTCVVILLCCLCSILLISVRIVQLGNQVEVNDNPVAFNATEEEQEIPGPTPVLIRPDESLSPVYDGTQEILEDTMVPVYGGTLEILENTIVPVGNLNDLAQRLGGIDRIPTELPLVTTALLPGRVESFWVTNTDTSESFQIDATLQYVTDHTYFWIENGIRYDQDDLAELAETFENKIYPLNREYFGSEWSPGIDGDPHLYIIYSGGIGQNLAGYYSSVDEYHSLAHKYSNMHETFMLNADNLDLGEEYTYGVLAHEFQHMIHWYQDRNEEAWLNEGFSELAAFINGYDLGGFDALYLSNPDLQLTDWPNDPSETAPHYGASFLYLTYFSDRFGRSATQSLVEHPENGLTSLDAVLTSIEAKQIKTGEFMNADDVFLDWVLTNYLQDSELKDGRFGYKGYTTSPKARDTEVVDSCPTSWEIRDVNQYGVDYIRITCPGDFILRFEGSIEVDLLPIDPYSGDFSYWSNKGDDSDMTLTQTFDFRDHEGKLTLAYWTWYDIEKDYDYVYLQASLDGESWQILRTPLGTTEDPSGNNFGWGYNGLSGEDGSWVLEEVDISQFAGSEVQIRFEYITDGAVNGEGFLLDDVTIPEIGYSSDFEADDGGWEAAGFVRVQNSLPQKFHLAIIEKGETTEVRYLELSLNNAIELPLNVGKNGNEIILVVTGTTRFTRQNAAYQFQLESK